MENSPSPLEAIEEDQTKDISPSKMEVVNDAPLEGSKRIRESNNSNFDELVSSMNCGHTISELQIVPVEPSLGCGLRSRRERKKARSRISFIHSSQLAFFFASVYFQNSMVLAHLTSCYIINCSEDHLS
jgi:hypothetical protein